MEQSNIALQLLEIMFYLEKKYTATFPEISFSEKGINDVYYCCKRFAVFVVALDLYI